MGHATMGIYTRPGGGTVFTAGTIDWAQGLATDPAVARITANVIDRLVGSGSGGEAIQPPVPGEIPGLLVRAMENPSRGRAVLEWAGVVGGDASVAIYDSGGRLVARIPVAAGLGHGTVTWNGRDRSGRLVPAGIYAARLEGFQKTRHTKFVLLR